MKKVFKLFIDFDKEEDWLNHMAAEGHLVRKAGPLYSFTPIASGSAVVRIDYRPSMSAVDFDDYKSLFSDAGWQHLSGSRTSGNQYFASTGDRGKDEIFSEAGSKAQRYRRAIAVNVSLATSFLVILILVGSSGSPVFANFFSPAGWYLTPGLWENKDGASWVHSCSKHLSWPPASPYPSCSSPGASCCWEGPPTKASCTGGRA